MAIRKRKNKWFVDLYPNGKRYRKMVGTKKQAEEVERRIKNEIAEGKWELREKDITFSKFLTRYFEYTKDAKAKSTYKNDKYRIEAHLLPYFGKTSLKEITPEMIDKYISKRLKTEAFNNTINHELVCLSHIIKTAIRWRYVDQNPVSFVEKLKVSKKNPRFLNIDEIKRLLESAQNTYIYPIILTAIHTGMRKSELLNLIWSDIDFNQSIVTIQPKDDWNTKNYEPRTVFLTPVLYEMLQKRYRNCIESGIRCEYVFTYKGARIKNGIDTTLRKVVKEAGLKDVTLHTLRHTFASQLAASGVPLRHIQELMGHQSYQTTLRYAHLSKEHVKKQVLQLPFAEDFASLGHHLGTRLD
ncbi:tyrosine-type recombinase/integrase [Candidatus Poribacteria bacterium]|nr:tyrosine-type recombinase/integrase [Candidatus Poribacteria bacterium]